MAFAGTLPWSAGTCYALLMASLAGFLAWLSFLSIVRNLDVAGAALLLILLD